MSFHFSLSHLSAISVVKWLHLWSQFRLKATNVVSKLLVELLTTRRPLPFEAISAGERFQDPSSSTGAVGWKMPLVDLRKKRVSRAALC